MTLAPGIYPSLRIEDYHKDESAVSKTRLVLMDKAPELFLHASMPSEESEESKSLELGRAFHALLDGSFEESFEIGPDVKSRAEKVWKDFASKNPGKTILKPSEYGKASAMALKVKSHEPFVRILRQPGRYEQTYVWMDEETGVLCKCRPDFITADGKTVVDFKSARDASKRAFQSSSHDHHYWVSAAFTLEGVFASTGTMPTEYLFFVVESSSPHLVAGYRATAEELTEGREFLRRNLQLLKSCREERSWPGIQDEIEDLGFPYYKKRRESSSQEDQLNQALSWFDKQVAI